MHVLMAIAITIGLSVQTGKDPLLSRLEGQWGTPETEQGETAYRLLADGKMEVVDRVKGKDGSWRAFGHSGLMKR